MPIIVSQIAGLQSRQSPVMRRIYRASSHARAQPHRTRTFSSHRTPALNPHRSRAFNSHRTPTFSSLARRFWIDATALNASRR